METRVVNSLEVRASKSGEMRVSGYAAKYGVLSHMLGGGGAKFRERIEPRAFEKALKTSDTVATINHDENKVLGRTTSGTLRLSSDSTGLAFECDLPDTSYARDLYALVKRGDLRSCSFAFKDAEDSFNQEDIEDENGQRSRCLVRSIRSVGKLFDVAIVSSPAYPNTSVAARSDVIAAEVRSIVERLTQRRDYAREASVAHIGQLLHDAHKRATGMTFAQSAAQAEQVIRRRRRDILSVL